MRRERIDDRLERMSTPEPNTGCWLWTGSVDWAGYGRIRLTGFRVRSMPGAHRVAWEATHGTIPTGMVLDHKCRVRCCVNPEHMRVVTVRENTLCGTGPTALHANSSHCKRGHPFGVSNTRRVVTTSGRTYRLCRACETSRASRKKSGVPLP